MGVDARGKASVQKLGMQEQMRDGFSYEMDIVLEIDNSSHLTHATKDRTQLFSDVPEFVITKETGQLLADWCGRGLPLVSAISDIDECETIEQLMAIHKKYPEFRDNAEFMGCLSNRKNRISNTTAAN